MQLPPPGDYHLQVQSTWDGTQQPFRLFVPPQYDGVQIPVLVCLHGMGADQHTWFDKTNVKDVCAQFGLLAVAPLGRGNLFWRGPAMQDVEDILDWLHSTTQVDSQSVFLVGHSMGGWGAWWVACGRPDRFAGLAPLSGFHPAGQTMAAGHLHPFLAHSEDDPIVSVEWLQEASKELRDQQFAHERRRLQGYGHDSRMISDLLPEIVQGFLARRTNRDARHFTLAARTPSRGHAHGVHMIELEAFGTVSTVKVEIGHRRQANLRPLPDYKNLHGHVEDIGNAIAADLAVATAAVHGAAMERQEIVLQTTFIKQLALNLNQISQQIQVPYRLLIDGHPVHADPASSGLPPGKVSIAPRAWTAPGASGELLLREHWLLLRKDGGAWHAAGLSSTQPTVVLPKVHIQRLGTLTPEALEDHLATLIGQATGADCVVLPQGNILPPRPGANADEILDIFLRPEETLAQGTAAITTLENSLSAAGGHFPLRLHRLRATTAPNGMATVVAPAPFARHLNLRLLQKLPLSIPEILVRAAI